MKAERTFETSETLYQSIRRSVLEDSNLYSAYLPILYRGKEQNAVHFLIFSINETKRIEKFLIQKDNG